MCDLIEIIILQIRLRNCHPIQSDWDAPSLTCILGRVT